MAAISAVIFGTTFTSCSHNFDLYEGGGDSNEKKEKYTAELMEAEYNAVFETVFGKVGQNVDWGFGSSSAGSRAATRSFTRAITSSHTFSKKPAAPAASVFAESVPDGVTYLGTHNSVYNQYDTYWAELPNNTCWVDAEAVNNKWKLHFDRYEGYVFYIKGEISVSDFYFTTKSKIYLTKDAKLNISGNYSCQSKMEFYIAEGAELNFTGKLETNGASFYNNGTISSSEIINSNGGYIYNTSKGEINTGFIQLSNDNCNFINDGTVTAKQLQVTNTSFFYNSGTLDLTQDNNANGELSVEKENSEVINDGTIIAKRFHTAGSGHLQNNGDMTITGNTEVDSNNASWVNNGTYETNNFYFTAGSRNVINNCRLIVDDEFDMNVGDGVSAFRMDAGASVRTRFFHGGKLVHPEKSWENATAGPFRVEMGANSLFEVTETATMGNTADNDFYGIFSLAESGYAVFKANKIEKVRDNQGNIVSYGGNLYVVSETTHFEQGYSGSTPYIVEKDGFTIENNLFTAGKLPKYTINESLPCNPGFEGEKKPENKVYRVICEDLSASDDTDFDFNDVVFDVYPDTDANGNVLTTGATIKLICAGGIYHLTVAGHEVHKEFDPSQEGAANGEYLMINTGRNKIDNEPEFHITVDCSTPEKINENIQIYVTKVNPDTGDDLRPAELKAEIGAPAAKVLVDQTFTPLKERESIKKKRPKFKAYVNGTLRDEKWWSDED